MSLYAISDLHLSLGSEKPMDIFSGWDNYVCKIEQNWKRVVKDTDYVVIAGDISWAMRLEEAVKDFSFIESLPGKKIIIKGNHDYWWSTVKKIEDFLSANSFSSISVLLNSAQVVEDVCICGTRGWLYKSGSQNDKKILLRESGRLKRSLDIAEKSGLEPIVFMHYPPVFGSDESSEIMDIMIERNIKRCYYGHIHGGKLVRKLVTGKYKGIELHLIACDYIDFSPILVK